MSSEQKNKSNPGKPRKPGRPRYKDGASVESTKAHLLEAAIFLFSRFGYDAISTGDIAKRANMTQSMVHYHFGSKLKIWKAAVHMMMRKRGKLFQQELEEAKGLPPVERLGFVTRKLIQANAQDSDFVQLAVHEGTVSSPRLKWLVSNYYAAGYRLFDEAIQAAIDEESIVDLPVAELTNIITAVSLLFSVQAIVKEIYGIDFGDKKVAASFSDTLVKILFNGLLVEGSKERERVSKGGIASIGNTLEASKTQQENDGNG